MTSSARQSGSTYTVQDGKSDTDWGDSSEKSDFEMEKEEEHANGITEDTGIPVKEQGTDTQSAQHDAIRLAQTKSLQSTHSRRSRADRKSVV